MPNTTRMNWPFPNENQEAWYESLKSFAESMDTSGYASREDRNLILSGGGTVDWDATAAVLEWDDTIEIFSPNTGFKIQIDAATVTMSEGQVLYVSLTRAPTRNVTLVPAVANQVPSSDLDLVLAVRAGTSIYWRNGLLMDDGDTVIGLGAKQIASATDVDAIHDNVANEIAAISAKGVPTGADFLVIEDAADSNNKKSITISTLPGLSTDRYGSGLIVGNSPNGDTADVCHVLDTGDGAVLKTAIEGAGLGTDVLVRPGFYDLSAGAAVAPIAIPTGVRVRGAGRGHTYIVNKLSGIQQVFSLGLRSDLRDLAVLVQLPTGPCTSASVIELAGERAECHRVNIGFTGVYTFTEAAYSALTACFGMDTSAANLDAKIVDCEVGDRGSPLPSYIDIGGKPPFLGLAAVEQGTITGADENRFIVDRLVSHGGDIGVRMESRMRLLNSSIYEPFGYGVWCTSSWCQISKNEIQMTIGGGPGDVGVYLDIGSSENLVEGNTIYNVAPSGLGSAISLNGSTNNRISSNLGAGGWQYGLNLSIGSDNNIALLNQMAAATTPYNDLGAGNDLAHNK